MKDKKPLVSRALREIGGFDNVEVRRLATNIEKANLLNLEKFYTRHHNTLAPNGYNEKCGMDWTDELKQRLSDSWTPEMRSDRALQTASYWTPDRKVGHSQFVTDWWTPERKAKRRQQALDYWTPDKKEQRRQSLLDMWTPEKRAAFAKQTEEFYTPLEKARRGFVSEEW